MNTYQLSETKLREKIERLNQQIALINEFAMQVAANALSVKLQLQPVVKDETKYSNSYYKTMYGIAQFDDATSGAAFNEEISQMLSLKILGLLLQQTLEQRQACYGRIRTNKSLNSKLSQPQICNHEKETV